MLTRALYWSVGFAVLLCVWLLFTTTLAWSETVVGVAAAALAATGTEAVRGAEHPRFLPQIRWLIQFRRLPAEILRDCMLLMRKLMHMCFRGDRRTGEFRTVPFRAGGATSRSAARRALAILYTTLPPNTIVIGIDRTRDVMLLHLLTPDAASITGRPMGEKG